MKLTPDRTQIFDIAVNSTENFTDLGKLNLLVWFGFRLKSIYATAPATSKNDIQFKSGQN